VAKGLRPTVDSVLPLEEVPNAMRRMVEGDLRGKIVITPWDCRKRHPPTKGRSASSNAPGASNIG
jgi:hypothetical protein